MGLTTDTKEVGKLVTVTISMLCLISLWILHYMLPKYFLSWEVCYIYFLWIIHSTTAPELYRRLYWYVCAYYNGVCVDMFVHLITVSVFLWLCMLYNLIAGYTSSWYSVIYLSCAWVIPPLHHAYIYVCINMFMSIISIFIAICLCTS